MAKVYNTVPAKSSGDTFTVGMWTDYIRTNINNVIVPPYCQLLRTAGDFSRGAELAIPFTVEEYDTDDMYATVGQGNVTIQTAGIYLATLYTDIAASIEYSIYIRSLLAGSLDFAMAGNETTGGGFVVNSCSLLRAFAVGDSFAFTCNIQGTASVALAARAAVMWLGRTA